MMIQFIAHYGIHFIAPILIAFYFYRESAVRVSIYLLLGILIDVDHLLATPIFEANRCSIDFHPLHSYWAIGVYVLLFALKKTRILGLALLIHIIADSVDCLFISTNFK